MGKKNQKNRQISTLSIKQNKQTQTDIVSTDTLTCTSLHNQPPEIPDKRLVLLIGAYLVHCRRSSKQVAKTDKWIITLSPFWLLKNNAMQVESETKQSRANPSRKLSLCDSDWKTTSKSSKGRLCKLGHRKSQLLIVKHFNHNWLWTHLLLKRSRWQELDWFVSWTTGLDLTLQLLSWQDIKSDDAADFNVA